MIFHRARRIGLAVLTAGFAATAIHAQPFPNKSIQLIVPYGAGPSDMLARHVGVCLSSRVRQSVVVLNKPGASGEVGANFVKLAPPDGHTLILAASATVTDLATKQAPTFDVRQDLEPISKLAFGVQGIFVNAALPIGNAAELVNYARANPGKLNYATTGIGSVNHLSTEAFSLSTGIQMAHIPYPQGTGPFLSALKAGEVQLALTDVGGAQAALDSGKVRLIGLLTRQRMPSRPAVPAIVETFPDMANYTGTLWYGFFAPPRTPVDVIHKAHAEITGCLNDPQVRASLRKMGYEDNQIVADTPAQFKASILDDIARLKEVVRQANIQLR